jgi:spore maturation protein CgeB
MATSAEFFHPVPPREEYKCDVLLLGAVHPDRIEPVKALVQRFNVHVHGENWEKYGIESRGLLYGEDTLTALNSAKMAVIFSKTMSGFPGVKVGVLDFLAAGCLVMTDDIPQLHIYFDVGREVVAFTDQKDMLNKIEYYLANPEAAEAILKAGRQRIINNYTWDKVWKKTLPTVLKVKEWEYDPNWINEYLQKN